MRVTAKTRVCALIGYPIEHSLSPTIHNAAFQHLGLDYIYVAFDVQPNRLQDAIAGVRGLGVHGLNVTMPHKISIIRYLDELDGAVRNIGSVNTVLNSGGILIGYTTDGVGALEALRHAGSDPKGRKIIVLGAGGASRSISFTLAEHARELIILNRTLEKALALAKDISEAFGSGVNVRADRLSEESLEAEIKDADVLINATSIGMRPKENETPVRRRLLHGKLTVFDIVYDPIETRLLREAKAAGAKTVDGLSMLVYQGAASFEIWTGAKAPVEVMRRAAIREVKGKKYRHTGGM